MKQALTIAGFLANSLPLIKGILFFIVIYFLNKRIIPTLFLTGFFPLAIKNCFYWAGIIVFF